MNQSQSKRVAASHDAWTVRSMRKLERTLGVARSWLIYRSRPRRHRRLVRFYKEFVGPGDLCFDLGAHLGNHTRAWLALGASVVALEPQPYFMRWLRWEHSEGSRVQLVEKAIGSREGTATLLISRFHPTVSTTSESWRQAVRRTETFAGVRWVERIPVEVTTLDCLFAEYGQPAFCKLDVEGAELEALQGCSEPLPALCFEFIPAAMEVALECIDRLCSFGDYEYQWNLGEPPAFVGEEWLPPAEMRRQLRSLAGTTQSGDVYARRKANASR